MFSFAAKEWLCIGCAVERELDDVSNIWAAASIADIHSAEGCVDLVYDDGSSEERVPIDELRVKAECVPVLLPDESAVVKPTLPDATSPCDEDVTALALRQPAPPARGFTATLRNLRCQAKRLTESVAAIRQGQDAQLTRLAAASLGVAQSTRGLRSSRRDLAEIAQRMARTARHVPRMPSSSKSVSGRGFDDVQALCESADASDALVESPSRSLRRHGSRTGTPTSRPSLVLAAPGDTPKHRTSRRARSSAGGPRAHASAMTMDLREEASDQSPQKSPFASVEVLTKPPSPVFRVRASSSVGVLRVSKAHPSQISPKARQHPLDWSMGSLRPKFGGAF